MPKLQGIDDKIMFGYKVDKENDDVAYNDEQHLYFSKKDGSKFISCTQIIHAYQPEFDALFWASYKACEYFLGEEFGPLKRTLLQTKRWKDSYLELYDIDEIEFLKKRDEVLKSYEDKKEEACAHGSKVHSTMESLFYQKDEERLKTFGLGGKVNVQKGNYKFDKERAVYPEILLSYEADNYLKLSGQADLVIKDGNEICIYDWKTSKEIKKESYYDRTTKKRQMMKFPLDNLQATNYWEYSLQLSLYMYMIEQMNSKFKCKKLAIIHIDRDGKETEYECEYLKEEVCRMLLHYRRQQKIKSELDLDKPIEF